MDAEAAENGRAGSAGSASHQRSGPSGSWLANAANRINLPATGPGVVKRSSGRAQRRINEMESTVAVLGEDAAAKMVRMGNQQEYNQVRIENKYILPRGLIHPKSKSYRGWWWLTIIAACITGWIEPYQIGFLPPTQKEDPPLAVVQYILLAIFLVDMGLSFLVSKYKRGILMTDRREIARDYARFRLWWDVLTTLPWDDIVLAAAGMSSNSSTARYIGLLGLLKLGRMYRLGRLFRHLVYNMAVDLLLTTVVRNLLLMFYLVNWFGCIFFFIARQEQYFAGSWTAQAGAVLEGKGPFEAYLVSVYWALSTFYTLGDGDISPGTTAEVAWVILYIVVNVFAWAYIMGSITLLVFKADEKVCHYRHTMRTLDVYFKAHQLPKELKALVQSHLRLQLSASETLDDALLSQLPRTIRQKVLREMYLQHLAACWLMAEVKPKFMDALLSVAKVQTLMPRVEILGPGDQVNELYIIVDGYVEVFNTAAGAEEKDKNIIANYSKAPAEIHQEMAQARTAAGSGYQVLGPGDVFGEMPFFTEVPQLELVRSMTICRVMAISRPSYTAIGSDMPQSARAVLQNLQHRAETMLQQEFRGGAASRLLRGSMAATLPGLAYHWASAEAVGGAGGGGQGSKDASGSAVPGGLSFRQEQVVANLQRVKALVKQTVASANESRTGQFLSAAARGEGERLKLMLQQGFQADTADYDNRTALMLAAANGRKAVVEMLLSAGANPNTADNLGSCALLEAIKAGHDDVMTLLSARGAKLQLPPAAAAQHLCGALRDGDVPRLRRLLECGADGNVVDYEGSTAAHVAAADGNLAAVKVLVEVGHVRLDVMSRHGATPLDEARAAQAQNVVEYLEAQVSEEVRQAAWRKFEEDRADAALRAAAAGDVPRLRRLLDRGCAADVADYDMRTALMLGAAKGHKGIVELLLSAGANPNITDNLGGCALLEAVKGDHTDITDLLISAGASLCLSSDELAGRLCGLAAAGDVDLLRRYIAAGADVNVGDYDRRTALHIAAAEGKLEVVRLLVEDGGADRGVTDRWGATPQEEADRVGAAAVVEYLKGVTADEGKGQQRKS